MRALDFNSLKRPTLDLTMMDDEQTVIHVSTPSVALVEKLGANADEIEAALQGGDKESVKTVYDFAAELISCNRDRITVTGTELREKYRLDLEDLTVFYDAYLEYLNATRNAKN